MRAGNILQCSLGTPIVATALALAGCQGSEERDPGDGFGGGADGLETGAGGVPGTTSGGGAVEGDGGGTGTRLDVAADDGGGGECAAVSETSSVGLQPADIIFVVDNSGSMVFEAEAVQDYLNGFSAQIVLADVDARVVLLSAYPNSDWAGICIDPPLGKGGCPAVDSNPPAFLHVNQEIGSNDGLQKLLDRYPDYASMMRSNSVKHIVVVSDDNADMDASSFLQAWKQLNPSFENTVVHAIAAPEGPLLACVPPVSPCCATSAAVGQTYLDLSQITGGLFGNLCDQEFQPIFTELAQEVVSTASLACEFEIPPPPNNQDFDRDAVNVRFDDGNGQTLEIGRVDDPAQCADVSDGWYYDDPNDPQEILLCPQTCDGLQGLDGATISLLFGCETIPAG